MGASGNAERWWHTQNEEYLHGNYDTREQAIEAGIWEYGGEPFRVCSGSRVQYQPCHFDIDRIAEDFDDANCEYGPEDEGPSAKWSDEACRELEDALTATMSAWLDKHGYREAWAIDAREYEQITASAIEAMRPDFTRPPGDTHDARAPGADNSNSNEGAGRT